MKKLLMYVFIIFTSYTCMGMDNKYGQFGKLMRSQEEQNNIINTAMKLMKENDTTTLEALIKTHPYLADDILQTANLLNTTKNIDSKVWEFLNTGTLKELSEFMSIIKNDRGQMNSGKLSFLIDQFHPEYQKFLEEPEWKESYKNSSYASLLNNTLEMIKYYRDSGLSEQIKTQRELRQQNQ